MALLEKGGDNQGANNWIKENHPQNGWFRVYWKNLIPNSWHLGGLTLDPDEGLGPRYQWYYVDGKVDGVAIGWWPSGMLKQKRTYIDGVLNGKWTYWYENGQKKFERNMRGGVRNGKCITWIDDLGEDWTFKSAGNGRKRREDIYKFQELICSSIWKWKEGFNWIESDKEIFNAREYKKWTAHEG